MILVDPNAVVGATIGDSARPVITEALSALGVETRLGVEIVSVDATGITRELRQVHSRAHGGVVGGHGRMGLFPVFEEAPREPRYG